MPPPPSVGCRGVISPMCGCSTATPPKNVFCLEKCVSFLSHFPCCLNFCVHCWTNFQHMVFSYGFLFLIKELGLLTYRGH
jgi:hypothetical protein